MTFAPLRIVRSLVTVLATVALCGLPVAAQTVQTTPADVGGGARDEVVWISLGVDAYDLVQDRRGFAAAPLEVFERRGEAVLTRVPARELDHISELLHRHMRRCPGFILHATRDEGVERLEAAHDLRTKFVAPSDFTVDQQTTVNALQPLLQASNILSTIQHLSTAYPNRYYVHASGRDSALWIRDQWAGLVGTRTDVTVDLVSHSGYQQPSVVATIQGATLPSEIVVLGGHLDSTASGTSSPTFSAPGADDNASGIAVLTEVLRVLLSEGFVPDRTIKFMGYAAEEVGLRGSGDIAQSHADAGSNVVGVLQLDMTDYNGSVQDIALLTDYTNSALTTFVGQLIDAYQPSLSWTTSTCGYACSDHASWHNRGFPAAMSFEAVVGQHNPQIHTANDTLATLGNQADHALKFARLALAFAAETGLDSGGGGGGGGGGGANDATYDASLGAPACAAVGPACDSASLLDSRGSLSPAEPNRPNTLDSCTDGNSGTYHSDESNDRLVVRTLDGGDLTEGVTVEVEATVYAYSNGSSDHLDLYYAADANSPSWTLIGTLDPPGGGVRTLTAQYTLPVGSLQAVRANFRYQGSASSCSTGNYDDTDDLVFAVAPGDGGGGGGGGGGQCAVDEDFETDAGGFAHSSSSTCSRGAWVRGVPTQQTTSGVVTQPAGGHGSSSGSAMFTATNSSAGSHDVDAGNCILESPTWSVADASNLSVWWFHGQRDSGDDAAGDFFRLELSTDGGATWSTLASNGDTRKTAAWAEATASIPAGSSVRLRVQASDGSGPGDIIEAGLDDVSICPQ